jgi:hypothetical protein
MNALDIELFEYAKELVIARLATAGDLLHDIQDHLLKPQDYVNGLGFVCPRLYDMQELRKTFKRDFGMFQPKGHKGPE